MDNPTKIKLYGIRTAFRFNGCTFFITLGLTSTTKMYETNNIIIGTGLCIRNHSPTLGSEIKKSFKSDFKC